MQLDIFNFVLSLSLALASKLPINKLPIGNLLASASDSDSESNELKIFNTMNPLLHSKTEVYSFAWAN